MSNYLVFIQAADYREVEASNENDAKSLAVESFKKNPETGAYDAEILRKEEDGETAYPVPETAATA